MRNPSPLLPTSETSSPIKLSLSRDDDDLDLTLPYASTTQPLDSKSSALPTWMTVDGARELLRDIDWRDIKKFKQQFYVEYYPKEQFMGRFEMDRCRSMCRSVADFFHFVCLFLFFCRFLYGLCK